MQDIAFMGFYEAGQAFAKGLQPAALRIAAYDLKLEGAQDGGPCRRTMPRLGVSPCRLSGLGRPGVMICLVTADQALTAQALLAARAAGVEDAVIASLRDPDPGLDWARRGACDLEQMLVQGTRRAAEMAEVAATLRELGPHALGPRDLGLSGRMAEATQAWQSDLAALALALDPCPDDPGARADLILRAWQ